MAVGARSRVRHRPPHERRKQLKSPPKCEPRPGQRRTLFDHLPPDKVQFLPHSPAVAMAPGGGVTLYERQPEARSTGRQSQVTRGLPSHALDVNYAVVFE